MLDHIPTFEKILNFTLSRITLLKMYEQVPGAIYIFYFSKNIDISLFLFSLGPIRDRNNRNRNNNTDNSTFEYIPQAIPAGCTPENITVPLNKSSDPNVFIWPNCIRSGSCASVLET